MDFYRILDFEFVVTPKVYPCFLALLRGQCFHARDNL